jgi:hypothetical protein
MELFLKLGNVGCVQCLDLTAPSASSVWVAWAGSLALSFPSSSLALWSSSLILYTALYAFISIC